MSIHSREEALQEWTRAETLHEARVTLHRYGRQHFSELAKASRRRS